MTAPRCDICEAELTRDDVAWKCACLECGDLHLCCVPCVALWGRHLPAGGGEPGVWAEVDLCPASARSTAELMGLGDLAALSKMSWEVLRGCRERAHPELGSDLRRFLPSGTGA